MPEFATRAIGLLGRGIGPEVDGIYEHWDHLRHLTPPDGLSPHDWWLAIKLARWSAARCLSLDDKAGRAFTVALTDSMYRKLHFLDKEAGGTIQIDRAVNDPTAQRYLLRSLMEEAMTSSQMEGAATTSQVAKEMLATGRPPSDRSERMIANNYSMMQSLRNFRNEPLTVAKLLEMHRILTHDTLEDPGEVGRFRTEADDIVVRDAHNPAVTLHVPPAAAELGARLDALCAFANASDNEAFLHPVVRAIAIHFQVGYDHPFSDGNGRTARALFYWSMLRSGYWLAEYLSISAVLNKSRAEYVRAFLYTESDESDMTYFVTHQLDVLLAAIEGLRGYLGRKSEERKQVELLLKPDSKLGAQVNYRQRALLLDAVRNGASAYAIGRHQAKHGVTYATARADLLKLVELKLLTQHRRGKGFVFVPVRRLAARLGV